ncbi:MAG: hypothetical protein JRM80_07320, partial [Nitrososphaerota archaeon]|nr:hypothetical protein [Nitrososphaerota archaeon]
PSIEEYKDCCAIITRYPKTRVKRQLIDSLSETLDFHELARRCISKGTLASFDHRTEAPQVTPLKQIIEERKLRAKRAASQTSLPNSAAERQ